MYIAKDLQVLLYVTGFVKVVTNCTFNISRVSYHFEVLSPL